MNRTQTASWSRLETLLNETTVKRSSVTPKSACKLDGSQPRLLKCLRKKDSKVFPSLNQLPSTTFSIKCETPTAVRGKIQIEPASVPAKSSIEIGTRTFVTLKEAQRGSLEELEQLSEISDDCQRNLYATNAYDDNDFEIERDFRSLQVHKFASVGAIKVTPVARNTEGQKKQNFIFCQSLIDNGLVLKRYKPVCGIADAQIRELYQLKCQDLKIAVFADSEDSFLQGTKKKSNDSKLCLHETGFGPKALEKLGQILQNTFQITQLNLRKSFLNGESMRSFARNVAQMPSLVHLELANNSIEPNDFIILFEELAASKTLVSIDLSNYESDRKNRISVECLEAWRKFAHGNIYLQFAKFINLMLEDDVVQGLLSALEGSPSLLSVNLSSNGFTGKCLESLTTLVAKTSLIQLDLSNNKLKKEGAVYIAKSIQGFRCSSREGLELILENTQLGEDINLILAAFGRDTNVSKMNFSHNILSNMELIRLENALAVNTKLTELNFSNCKIGETVGKLLSLGLQKNKSLQNLNLDNNDLGDEISAHIIYSLIDNHSFRFLDMTKNHLASESAKALQELMKKNPGVNKYNLSLNKFDEKEGYLLQEALYFNPRIIQFNLHHNPVKYNTIETIERIIKDNQRKLIFQSVPQLKDEVARKKVYIREEKHAMGKAVEKEKVKVEVKRDVERFQETLKTLKDRPESPTIKKNEKVLIKLGKELRNQNKGITDTILKARDFTEVAFMESEGYKDQLEIVEGQIKQASQKIEVKKRDIEDMQKKYEPEIKRLKFEISKLKDENNFLEMYNDTLSQKIKKEKKKNSISNQAPNPKISDMFLATSELARHKKKHNEPQEKALESTKSRIGAHDSHSHLSQISEDPKIVNEYNFAIQNQQLRINKLVKVNENATIKIKKKKNSIKSENSDQENIKERIQQKIKSLIKEDHGPVGSILGQIADN